MEVKVKPSREIIAIDVQDLRGMFAQHLQCEGSKHQLNLDVSSAEHQISLHCQCSRHMMPFHAEFFTWVGRRQYHIVLLSREVMHSISAKVKQKCGYIPRISVQERAVAFSCGHHKQCPSFPLSVY